MQLSAGRSTNDPMRALRVDLFNRFNVFHEEGKILQFAPITEHFRRFTLNINGLSYSGPFVTANAAFGLKIARVDPSRSIHGPPPHRTTGDEGRAGQPSEPAPERPPRNSEKNETRPDRHRSDTFQIC